MDLPYISGTRPIPELPLGRFIPPIPEGMVSAWCKKYLSPGDWVLEPFGFNPLVPIEIAAAGYHVLVTVNNPIHAFMLKIIASAPQEQDLIAALQDLAIAPKGEERMEPYIRSLYRITCASCQRQIEAEGFLWEKGSDTPFAAQVKCPYCGAEGEQEITDEDLNNLADLPPLRLHQARALNRIIGSDNALRPQVSHALNAYPARPLIVLQTIINKLDTLEQTPRHRDLLTALILSAADHGNTLWAYPTPRNRPRQIVVPNVYQERNLWKVLEEAVQTWQIIKEPIPLQIWDGASNETQGIQMFPGRIKELFPLPKSNLFSAVLATIPRPNQAFWTFSTLWTGWIWGQNAVSPIRNVLSRQRYDWNWHTNALHIVFDALRSFFHPEQHLWGLVAENEPMLLLASLLAAESSGFQLSAFSLSIDDQIAQCYWRKNSSPTHNIHPAPAIHTAKDKIRQYLIRKGEPAGYQQVHASAISGLADENKLAIDIFLQNPNSAASETQKWIETVFSDQDFLIRVGGGTASIETGEWWLTEPSDSQTPLIDRVETTLLQYLQNNEVISAQELKRNIYQQFPGMLTPEDKLLLNCLESYADLIDPQQHLWRLRDKEKQQVREMEMTEVREMIKNIGRKLNYKIFGDEPLLWLEEDQVEPAYSFHIFSTAMVSKHFEGDSLISKSKLLVLPGSRANLLAFKKQRDPVLAEKLSHGFIEVKFRLIRDLMANPLLSRDLFNEQINVDPPEYQTSQLALF